MENIENRYYWRLQPTAFMVRICSSPLLPSTHTKNLHGKRFKPIGPLGTIDYRQYNTKYNSKFDVRLLTDLKRVLSVAARKVICIVIQFVNSGLYRKQAA